MNLYMNWRDTPSLAALRAFEAAARHGSLSRAADDLNVTHAAIAQHLRALEADLETPLMHRAGRGMRLTPEGSALATELNAGFAQVIAGVRAIRDDAGSRPLAVTLTPNFAENWLMPRMGGFWAAHPDITVSLTPSNASVDLRRDGYDLGLRYGKGDWPGVTSEMLVPVDFIVAGAPALVAERRDATLDQLSELPWLFEAVHTEQRSWAVANGLDETRAKIREMATMSMVMAAVKSGAALSVFARATIETDLARGTLVGLQEAAQPGIGYHLIRPSGIQTKAAKTFAAWLRGQAA